MYKLLTTAYCIVTWSTIAVDNPLSGVESGAQATCTLGHFVLNSSDVLMCSESVVLLFSGVRSEAGGGLIIFNRSYQNITFVCVEELFLLVLICQILTY